MRYQVEIRSLKVTSLYKRWNYEVKIEIMRQNIGLWDTKHKFETPSLNFEIIN